MVREGEGTRATGRGGGSGGPTAGSARGDGKQAGGKGRECEALGSGNAPIVLCGAHAGDLGAFSRPGADREIGVPKGGQWCFGEAMSGARLLFPVHSRATEASAPLLG